MRFLVLMLFLSSFAHAETVREKQLREMEKTMAGLVNADRKANGLPPLEWDWELANVARAHSLDMATHNFFSHRSPTTGMAADRIFKAGLGASATAENLAKDFDVGAAQAHLMHSPGHRKNILAKDYDRLGVGVVELGGYLWFTQNFRKALHVADIRQETQKLFDRMNRARRAAGVPDLEASRVLMQIARDVATAENEKQKLLGDLPAAIVKKKGTLYRSFWAFTGLDMDTDQALRMSQLKQANINKVGIGLVQNRSKKKGLGMIWMCVLIAEMD